MLRKLEYKPDTPANGRAKSFFRMGQTVRNGFQKQLNRRALCAPVAFTAGIMLLSCESAPPQINTAQPISWGESAVSQLAPQTETTSTPWRKIDVLTRGVLSIGLQSNDNGGKIQLNVRSANGRSNIFRKEIELAPKAPINITLNVEAGTYYMILEPLQGQVISAAISARFQPEDPDALSGPDKKRDGAQLLVNAQAREGAVSYKHGNRTNWYKYEVPNSETLDFRFSPASQAKGVKAECISPTGISFELSAQDKLVVREPGTVWIRVYADQSDSGGGYSLSASSSPVTGAQRKGIILKYQTTFATINMGADDGIREGLKGYIQRPDGTLVDFVIEKALRRSSTAKSASKFQDSDLNLTVHFEKK
jgi:hypothetical protein